MFGVILLYGAPTVDGDYLEQMIPEDQIAEAQKKIKAAQAAIDTFMKLFGLDG